METTKTLKGAEIYTHTLSFAEQKKLVRTEYGIQSLWGRILLKQKCDSFVLFQRSREMQKKSIFGRSMLEMLGVLAIIGILSIALLFGYVLCVDFAHNTYL